MWRAKTEDVASGRKYRLLENRLPLSFRELIRLLDCDGAFSDWYSRLLIDCSYDAFYWECPPVTRDNLDQEAEFVLVNAPTLATVTADPAPFKSYFADQPGDDIVVFPNLGGDAVLIVPCPVVSYDAYPHLAAFIRRAPATQIRSLWQRTARAVVQNVTSTPRWLSTAGLGVPWLHVRIDTRPKYYSHVPYTRYP